MKYISLLLAFALFSVTACRKNQRLERVYTFRNTVYSNKTITGIAQNDRVYYRVQAGHNSVFVWDRGSDIPHANDAATGSQIVFQADSGVTAFTYTDNELADHLCYHESFDGWGGGGQYLLNKGTISGKKNTNGSWLISLNLQLPETDDYVNGNLLHEVTLFTPGTDL